MRLVKDPRKHLKRKWKKRSVLWLFYFIAAGFALFTSPTTTTAALVYVLTIAMILLDEEVKEGYLFKRSDVRVIPSHEFLTVLMIVLSPLIVLVKLLKRLGGDKHAG